MMGQTATVHCGSKHYTFAIKQSRLGKSYLEIAEHRANGLLPASRQILYVFPEYATKFGVVVNMMLGNLEKIEEGRAHL